MSFDPLRGYSWGGKGGPDDALVERAHEFVRQVFVDRHPEALFDFLGLHCQVGIQGSETAYEVDVGLPVPVPVPMPEADQRLEPGLHSRFLQNLPGDRIHQMLARLERPAGKLVVAATCRSVTLAHDEQFASVVDDHATDPDVMRGMGRDERVCHKPAGHHHVMLIGVVEREPLLRS